MAFAGVRSIVEKQQKWDRTWRNAWGNVSILIGQNQTEQKDLKMTLFFNSLNVSEIIGSSSGVPKLIVKYFWCSLELVIVADIVG